MSWKELPAHTRVWVYQADRLLTEEEAEWLKREGESFTRTWDSHGNPLSATTEVFHRLFLVIFVDEAQAMASGCSIDKSVAFVKRVEQDLGIQLMDRMQVAYLEGDKVAQARLTELATLASAGKINANTPVFNNLVSTLDEFEKSWTLPMGESWHARYLV